jgi:hypothetical protein
MVQNLVNNIDNESETSGDTDKSNEGESSDLNSLYDDCTPLGMGLTTVGNRPRYTGNISRITNRNIGNDQATWSHH